MPWPAFAVRWFFFGFKLDPDKSSGCLAVYPSLGVEFDVRHSRQDQEVKVRPKKSRLDGLRAEFAEIRKKGLLKPARAGRLVGKLQFVGDSLFNKVGRAGLGAFRRRQHQRDAEGAHAKQSRFPNRRMTQFHRTMAMAALREGPMLKIFSWYQSRKQQKQQRPWKFQKT